MNEQEPTKTTPFDPASDPMSALAMGATAVHEWYTSLCAAGFTELEALTLISKVIVEQGGHS